MNTTVPLLETPKEQKPEEDDAPRGFCFYFCRCMDMFFDMCFWEQQL